MRNLLPFVVVLLYTMSTSAQAQEQLSDASSAAAGFPADPIAEAVAAPAPPWAYWVGPTSSQQLRMNPDAAALLGGVVGAIAGFGLMRLTCRNRYCEMGDLIGLLGGFVVGSGIGYVIGGGKLPPRYGATAHPSSLSGAEFFRQVSVGGLQVAASERVAAKDRIPWHIGTLGVQRWPDRYWMEPNSRLQGTPGGP